MSGSDGMTNVLWLQGASFGGGVADFDNATSTTNQAFGISVGSPTGIPASVVVSGKFCAPSNPSDVRAMQV